MSVVPRRKWRRSCYAQQTFDHPHLGPANVVVAIKAHRRYSSGPVPISPLANKTLGEFVKARKLEVVLETYPADMPLTKVIKIHTIIGYCFHFIFDRCCTEWQTKFHCNLQFCQICPNSVDIEDESIRSKVMIAIHAARAHEVRLL